MIIKNYSYARQNLKALMTKVNDDSDMVTVTSTDDKNVVIMSESDYNSMMETLYLQQSPNNAEHLAQSIADLERGKTITKDRCIMARLNITFSPQAFEDYKYFQQNDKKW